MNGNLLGKTMNESELETLRIKVQLVAHQVVLRAICNSLERQAPAFLKSLLETANHNLLTEAQHVVMTGYAPEWSDLIAGEFQDAYSGLLKSMASGEV